MSDKKKADNTTPTIQAAIQAAYSLNVGNLRDTGHSAEATPPAAKAEQETVRILNLNFRSWPGARIRHLARKPPSATR